MLILVVVANLILILFVHKRLRRTERMMGDVLGQFHTNEGSSLRDVANRLETATKSLQAGADDQKKLSEEGKAQIERLLLLSLQLSVAVGQGQASTKRLEDESVRVRDDLTASQKRADDMIDGEAGAAADAAAQTDKEGRQE